MGWRLAIEEDAAVLKRIVALLFALADLAELAASQSPAVRALVLWLLGHGAAAAARLAAFVPDALPSTPIVPADRSPADAMRLAATLRALAIQIDLQARLMSAALGADCNESERLTSAPASAMRSMLHALTELALVAGLLHPLRAPDTS